MSLSKQSLLQLEQVREVDVRQLAIADLRQHAQTERQFVVAEHGRLVRLLPLVQNAALAGTGQPLLDFLTERLGRRRPQRLVLDALLRASVLQPFAAACVSNRRRIFFFSRFE
jgi:hypothetical protein